MRTWVWLAGIAALALAAPGPAEPQSVASAWNARALRAADQLPRLEQEVKALRKSGAKRDSDEVRRRELAAMLERAFVDHLDPKLARDLHRVLPGGDEVFTLVLNAGRRKGSFALSYLYDQSGRPMGVRILQLPENWSVLLPGRGAETDRRLLVDPGVPGKGAPTTFVFDLEDATASAVMTKP